MQEASNITEAEGVVMEEHVRGELSALDLHSHSPFLILKLPLADLEKIIILRVGINKRFPTVLCEGNAAPTTLATSC